MAKRAVHVRIGNAALPVGTMVVEIDGTREASAFTYDPGWLSRGNAFGLSPAMPLRPDPYFTSKAATGSPLPSPVADGAPDSWGRAIIRAVFGGRMGTQLDYLVEADDFLRAGALRYFDGPGPEARALAPPPAGKGQVSVPRLLDLGQVIAEARAFEADPVHYREKRARMVGGELLRNAVGSLGGARPKVNARDDDGALWIVKLAKADDEYAVARAEVMALRLARQVGISAAEASVLSSAQRFPVATVRRFDRDGRGNRIPFISAQTFMGLPGTEEGNYVDVAFQMLSWSSDPEEDRRELYRRMLFNVLIQNTDDHLRNLGFLLRGDGKWSLSPAYDVNPVPEEGTTLKTAISVDHGNALDVDAVIEVSKYFGIKQDEASAAASAMAITIKDEWRAIGTRLGMTGSDLKAVAPAMENRQVERAIELGKAAMPGAALP